MEKGYQALISSAKISRKADALMFSLISPSATGPYHTLFIELRATSISKWLQMS